MDTPISNTTTKVMCILLLWLPTVKILRIGQTPVAASLKERISLAESDLFPVFVGYWQPAILAKSLRGDFHAGGGLAALVLVPVAHPHDSPDEFLVKTHRRDLRDALVLLHVCVDYGVEDFIRRKRVHILLVRPKLGGRGALDNAVQDYVI